MFDPIAYINEPRWQESRLGLERIAGLLERMGRPQDRLRFVHVAGTNGKGSTCAFLESILRRAGLRTGLFTSPYIIEFAERIRVCGENISLDDLRAVTLFVRGHAEALAAETGEHPTEFELMTAVAFEHFARAGCDIVVCEVGLGGRLDSTNVIEAPEACVICRIGLDHVDLLGDTPAAIAREKAGIVKPGAPVVSWPQEDAGAMAAVEEAARVCGSDLRVPDFSQLEVFPVEEAARPFAYRGARFSTRLLGSYQPANAVLAIEVARVLGVDEAAIAEGVAGARWPGRFEVVEYGAAGLVERAVGEAGSSVADGVAGAVGSGDSGAAENVVPLVIDGGHNPQGAAVLAESLRDVFAGRPVVFVMSVLADKDYRVMITEVAPLACAFVCATPPNPRALSAADLAKAVRVQVADEVPVEVADSFAAALARARELAPADGVVCMFGSLYSISALSD